MQERLRQQREEAARRLGNDTAMEAARQAAILKQEQAQIRGQDSPPKTVSSLPLSFVASHEKSENNGYLVLLTHIGHNAFTHPCCYTIWQHFEQ